LRIKTQKEETKGEKKGRSCNVSVGLGKNQQKRRKVKASSEETAKPDEPEKGP